MVKTFQFRDHKTKLDIAGHIFEVDTTDPESIRKIQEFGQQAIKQDFLDKDDEYIVQVEKSLEFMHNAIDSILGEGATEQIFEGRSVSFLDMLDILNYVNDVVLEARKKQFDKYSPERVKRSKK